MLDGKHASDFISTSNDAGRYNVVSDLYEGTLTLSSKYAPASGSSNYIQNLSLGSQSASFSISGTGTAGSFQAGNVNMSLDAAIAGFGGSGYGIYASSSSNCAIYATNNSSNTVAVYANAPNTTAFKAVNNTNSYYAAAVYNDAGSSAPGLYVQGTIYHTGANSNVIATSKGAELISSIESPDVEVYTDGTAKLKNGSASVQFDRLYSEAISAESSINITLTTVGSWSGLYIQASDSRGFLVVSQTGDLNASFNWIAIAKKKGFEERPVLSPALIQAMKQQNPKQN
jgi:hypothetical protein